MSNIAGTTRDAVDSSVENENGKYIKDNIERYSIIRTMLAIERADVCILMIDANERSNRTRYKNCRRST